MNKKILLVGLLIDAVIIGLAYLITPKYLGEVTGFISGFISGFIGTDTMIALIILFILLFYPAFWMGKKFVK